MMLEWVAVVVPLLLSWPVTALVIVAVFRKPLRRFLDRAGSAEEATAAIGPVRIELRSLAKEGQAAVDNMKRLNILMAESRLLELEITEGNFGLAFSSEQRARMQKHMDELRNLTATVPVE